MKRIVFVRHGESQWNKENRFTGWTDVDLSEKGIEEAKEAGRILREEGYCFDIAYTSVLKRAIKTLNYILDEMDLLWIPVHKSWRLNERHYGALQGLNKAETAAQYGEEQVKIWRRSYDILPTLLTKEDVRYPKYDLRYQDVDEKDVPLAESLKETVLRVIPYWECEIVPKIKEGKRVIIAAHGNSLRALVKYLDNINEKDIVEFNIPTGIPLVYEFNDDMTPVNKYYLGDMNAIQDKISKVANQGKKVI